MTWFLCCGANWILDHAVRVSNWTLFVKCGTKTLNSFVPCVTAKTQLLHFIKKYFLVTTKSEESLLICFSPPVRIVLKFVL